MIIGGLVALLFWVFLIFCAGVAFAVVAAFVASCVKKDGVMIAASGLALVVLIWFASKIDWSFLSVLF